MPLPSLPSLCCSYGEDPFWASVAAVHATQGLQRSNSSTEYLETAAVARHMAAFSGPVDEMNFSVTVDNRTMHDTYLPALEAIMVNRALAHTVTHTQRPHQRLH